MTNKVDNYFKKQPSPQKEVCERLRGIILRVCPDIREEIKWGVPTYGGGIYYIVALKDHVNLGFSVAGLSAEELQPLTGSGRMKHLAIRTVDDVDEARIAHLLQVVGKANR